MRRFLFGVLLALLSQAGVAFAQVKNDSVEITKVQIDAALKKALAERTTDQTLSWDDIGHANIGAGFVIRRPPDASGKQLGNIGGPLIHDKVTEVYIVTAGSGEQVTGGKILDGKPQGGPTSAIGPGLRGTKMEGGRVTRLVAGDIQIIPAGTVHMWKSVGPQGIDYVVLRIDPEKATKVTLKP